jgi:hypothetical protein
MSRDTSTTNKQTNKQTNKEATWCREISALQIRLTKLEHQQNMTIANSKAQAILNLGQIPSIYGPSAAPALYGLQVLNPGSGNLGTPLIQLGQQYGSTYGLEVFDPDRTLRVQLGELDKAGDYGLRVLVSTGAGIALLPSYDATVSTQESTTSTTYTDLATVGPEIMVQVGSSGRVQVTSSAFIQVPVQTSQAGGFAGISIDGAAPSRDSVYLFNSIGVAAGYFAGSYSATTILTGLSQGSHTLQPQFRYYASSTGANFAEMFIVALGLYNNTPASPSGHPTYIAHQ